MGERSPGAEGQASGLALQGFAGRALHPWQAGPCRNLDATAGHAHLSVAGQDLQSYDLFLAVDQVSDSVRGLWSLASGFLGVFRNVMGTVAPIAALNNYLLPVFMIVLGLALAPWRANDPFGHSR